MRAPKLCWIVKQWDCGVITYSMAGTSKVYASVNGPQVLTPFYTSHAAAAEWAAIMIGKSLDALAEALR